MLTLDRSRTVAAAQAILDQGGWCVLEACVDVPSQQWEPLVLIFDLIAEGVADVIGSELRDDSVLDARLTGCDRRTLAPRAEMGAYLFYVGDADDVWRRSSGGETTSGSADQG